MGSVFKNVAFIVIIAAFTAYITVASSLITYEKVYQLHICGPVTGCSATGTFATLQACENVKVNLNSSTNIFVYECEEEK